MVKVLKSQNLQMLLEACTNVEEINPFKALKNPAHGRTVGRLVDLIGNRLRGGSKLATEVVFG